MRRRRRLVGTIGAGLLALTLACAPAGGPPAVPSVPPTETIPIPAVPTVSPVTRPTPPPIVDRVVADAAQRAGVPRERVRVLQVEPREWRDTSLGCPEPGKFYAQVITPGYVVIVEAGGRTYEYHTGRGDLLVLCQVT